MEIVEKCGFSTGIPGFSNSVTRQTHCINQCIIHSGRKNRKIMSPGKPRRISQKKEEKLANEQTPPGHFPASPDFIGKFLWKFYKYADSMFFIPEGILR